MQRAATVHRHVVEYGRAREGLRPAAIKGDRAIVVGEDAVVRPVPTHADVPAQFQGATAADLHVVHVGGALENPVLHV